MARNKYDVDEVLETGFNTKQLKRLLRYITPYRGKMTAVIFMMLSGSALTMVIPMFLKQIMDVYIPDKNMNGVILVSVLTLLIAVYSSTCTRLKVRTMSVIGQSIIHTIRSDIFCHLQELPFSYYDDRPHGKIQVRVVNYVNNLSDLLSNGIVNTITDLCNLVFIVAFMLINDVRLTGICMCGLPVLAAVVIFIKRRQRRAW